MNIFLQTILEYLGEVVGLVIVTLLGIFGSWLLSKLKNQTNLKNIAAATEEVIKAAQTTVMELQQTLVTDWKASQNGKLTEEQKLELQDKVLTITMDKLSDPVIGLLEGAKVDLMTTIMSAAEAYIAQLKKPE